MRSPTLAGSPQGTALHFRIGGKMDHCARSTRLAVQVFQQAESGIHVTTLGQRLNQHGPR
jgi:hypothetical protein